MLFTTKSRISNIFSKTQNEAFRKMHVRNTKHYEMQLYIDINFFIILKNTRILEILEKNLMLYDMKLSSTTHSL